MMDWQSILAVGVAALSGLWIVRHFAQPFLAKRRVACSACGANCNAQSENLVQIEVAD